MNENFLNFDNIYNEYLKETKYDWINGACYVRVSTKEQTEYSPTSQLKLILNYAIKNNIFIKKEYIFHDDGISGRDSTKRDSFLKMISVAESLPKPFDLILVYDFSRFARNKYDAVKYKSHLRKDLNIDVVSITQPLSNGKDRIILESMYEGMDEYYSLNLAEGSKRGKKEKAFRNRRKAFSYA